MSIAQADVQDAEEIAPTNTTAEVLTWLSDHGPVLVGIVAVSVLLLWLGNILESRLVELLCRRFQRAGREEREARARTLASVAQNAACVAIVFAAATMILSELSVDVSVILGGAAVIGLAAAFGAQNLIRDYFTGFVMLLENQYRVNDVVKIGNIGGTVERVTLRITALRDQDGTLHFIPNGQITTVSNKTHGWSRALFMIPVDYKEDVDRVMDVLREIGTELRAEPEFEPFILDDPEMLGVDELGDSAVIVKFFMKTRPLKRWRVKREMLRRIKKRFDELHISIPVPQRMIHHRYEDGGSNRTPREHQFHESRHVDNGS